MFFKTKEFIKCLLRANCEYSIKKLFAIIFAILALYLAIFTIKTEFFLETVGFVAALLAIRSYDKRNGYDNYYPQQYNQNNQKHNKRQSKEELGDSQNYSER